MVSSVVAQVSAADCVQALSVRHVSRLAPARVPLSVFPCAHTHVGVCVYVYAREIAAGAGRGCAAPTPGTTTTSKFIRDGRTSPIGGGGRGIATPGGTEGAGRGGSATTTRCRQRVNTGLPELPIRPVGGRVGSGRENTKSRGGKAAGLEAVEGGAGVKMLSSWSSWSWSCPALGPRGGGPGWVVRGAVQSETCEGKKRASDAGKRMTRVRTELWVGGRRARELGLFG
jgi:hypothetical protein